MRRSSILSSLAMAILFFGAAYTPGHSQVLDLPPHPRLIVYSAGMEPTRLEELRSQVDETGSPQEWSERKKALVLALRSLRAGSHYWYGQNTEAEQGESPIHQDEQYRCVATLALTDLLMKSKGSIYPEYEQGRIYAEKANAFLHWWRDHGYYNWGSEPGNPSGGSELGFAEVLASHALFYDWCYDYLSASERAYHARAIYNLMTDEERLYHFAYGDWRQGWFDNNHLGVIFGAVGLAALALDQDDPIFNQTAQDSIAWYRDRAASRIREYLDASFPEDGAGIEGVLYAMYGLNLALPYALATQRLRTVEPGYDPLPPNMRVDSPRNAYQATTWLYCEQLPFNPCGGTPLNDTAIPPYDINADYRAWPWLMAFSTQENPNMAKPFFHTIYPPAMIEAAVLEDFDPEDPTPFSDPFDRRQMVPPGRFGPADLNSIAILLGWPEADPVPALDPEVLERGRYFSGRGITYFRSGIQSLLPDGSLDWRPDSCLITFECRQQPAYPPGFPKWSGHTQEDVNHFTIFFARQPLFYDSGYAGFARYPSFYSIAHSLHEVRVGSGPWEGFSDRRTQGTAIGSVVGAGEAPSLAGGINTECWSLSQVDRSVRRMVVLPRPDAPAPYLLLHDDFDLTGSGKIRANMQTGNEYEGGSVNAPALEGNTARWQKGEAEAVLSFLAPTDMAMSTPILTPNDPVNWPTHWVVRAEVPFFQMRHQIVSLIEPRFADDGGPELIEAVIPIPTSDPEGLAYQIDSGRLIDIVAFRPYDRTEDWIIYPEGYPPIEVEQATLVAMRFDESANSNYIIRGGVLSGGGTVYCDGSLVAALSGDAASSLTFSEAGASAWVDGEPEPEFAVAPMPMFLGPDPPPEMPPLPEGGSLPGDSWVLHIPNPLRPGTLIDCGKKGGTISIAIYDTSGRLLRTMDSGNGRIQWDGRDSNGEVIPSGVYLLRGRMGGSAVDRKVVILH